MSKTVICIVGKSGTGKTSLALHLRHYIPVVSSRTTRKAREGEIHGEAPYHKFLTSSDYLHDVVTSGKVAIGDLSRGSEYLVADTTSREYTSWATTTDLFISDKNVIAYIVDPTGVANLKKAIDKAGELILKHNYRYDQCPDLYKMAELKIKVLYVSAVEKVLEKTSDERKRRDSEQELGWNLCELFADYTYITPYIEDERQRHIQTGLTVKRLSEKLLACVN